MRVTLQELATVRIDRILADSMNTYERLADLLADILHYAHTNNIDFNEELETAEMYVSEEESMDMETIE